MKFYIGSGFKNVDRVRDLSNELKKLGWIHTYNWAEVEVGSETREELVTYSRLELAAIEDSDIVIIILPAGRGTHIEMGYAMALGKRIVLYTSDEEEFSLDNTVNFYQIPEIEKIVGDKETLIKRLTR